MAFSIGGLVSGALKPILGSGSYSPGVQKSSGGYWPTVSPANAPYKAAPTSPSPNNNSTQTPADQTVAQNGGTGGQVLGASTTVAPADNPIFDQFKSSLGTITDAYNSLFSNSDQQAQSRENQDIANYNNQKNELSSQYETNMRTLPGEYGARGLGSSSYFENGLNDANQTYQQNMNDIGNQETSDLTALQSADQQAKTQGQYFLNSYNQDANLFPNASSYQQTAWLGELQNQLAQVQGQAAGTGSNQSFLSNIAAPVKNQGASALQSQLDALSGAATTGAAKNQIASGLIGSSNLDPNTQQALQGYWQQKANA